MIKDIPLDNRIAIIGIDRTVNFNYCLEWYEQFKTENLFEKQAALDWLFEHANWCICCVKDSLKVKDERIVTCERLTCGRFTKDDFIGTVNTEFNRYNSSAKIDFLGDSSRHYIVFDGTGQMVTNSRLVPDLWQPDVFVKTIESCINNIDYIAIDDICL